jgi:hypothetical protein
VIFAGCRENGSEVNILKLTNLLSSRLGVAAGEHFIDRA